MNSLSTRTALSHIIVPYRPTDLQRVLGLFRLNTPGYFHPDEEKDLIEFLANHGETYFFIEDTGSIIAAGGYHLTYSGTVGRLSWDFIHPDYQGKGFGSILIQHCLNLMEAMPDVQSLAVWTSQHAAGFYARFGFKTVEIRPDYWGPGLELHRMEWQKQYEPPR